MSGARLAVVDQAADLIPYPQARELHAHLHDLAGLLPDLYDIEGLLDRLGHRLLDMNMLSGLQSVDDLRVLPVVGHADADRIDVLVGAHVGVVDITLWIGADLLLNGVANRVFLILIDLADGNEIARHARASQTGERLEVHAKAAIPRADEADPNPNVHRSDGNRCVHEVAP